MRQHRYKQLNKVLPAYFFVSNIQKQNAIFFFSFLFFMCAERSSASGVIFI